MPKSDDDKKPEAKDSENPVPKDEVKDAPKDETPTPKAAAKAKADEPPAPPPAPRRTIEELLADTSFDPDGLVRSRLATLSSQGGVGQMAPATLVDDQGKPIRQEA